MAFKYDHVIVLEVVDGDTLEFEIDQGFETFTKTRIRVLDLDTHETRRIKRKGKKVSEAEVAKGKECENYVRELLLGKEVKIETHKSGKGKFGRYLVSIEFEKDGEYIDYAEHLKELGYDRDLNPL